jgi:hypothetical protein
MTASTVEANTMKLFISQIVLVSLTISAGVHASPHRGPRPNEDIKVAYRDLGLIARNEKDLAHSGATQMSKKFAEHAQACSAEVRKRLESGESGNTVVRVTAFAGGPRELKLGEVEATVCRPLADKAKSWDASVSAAHTGAADAVAAPYKAAGIGGEKLAFLVSQKGESDFYGVGGSLLRTPEAIKNASVLFILSGGGTGEKWTLYRRQFSGDRLTGSSQRDFLVRPGATSFQ